MVKYVEWVEPRYSHNELPVHVILRCTPEHAANYAKNTCKQLGRTNIYVNDEEALEDFMVIHWAEFKEYETEKEK